MCSDLQYDILTMSVTVSMHIPRSEWRASVRDYTTADVWLNMERKWKGMQTNLSDFMHISGIYQTKLNVARFWICIGYFYLKLYLLINKGKGALKVFEECSYPFDSLFIYLLIYLSIYFKNCWNTWPPEKLQTSTISKWPDSGPIQILLWTFRVSSLVSSW